MLKTLTTFKTILFLLLIQLFFLPETVLALSPVEVAEKVNPATVGIYALSPTGKFYGTGVIISSKGYVLTSTTVIPQNSNEISVYFANHTKESARVIKRAEKTQSVLLMLNNYQDKSYPFLALNKSSPLIGEEVFTAGNANNMIKLGDGVSFSAGVVSGIYKLENSKNPDNYQGDLIETDAAINDGQDGGGLINTNAEVIGIISKEFSPLRWQGTSIPINAILDELALPSFIENDLTVISSSFPTTQPPFINKLTAIKNSLVSINVDRLYSNEKIIFPEWTEYKSAINEWENLSSAEKRRRIVDFFSCHNLITANQMLRRPDNAVTGILISPEGHILTSAFNVESADSVYIEQKTQKRKLPQYVNSIENLTDYDLSSLEKINNRVISIEITLADGRKKLAEILGFNIPLGIAVLKINSSQPLPFFDIKNNSATAVTGEEIALIGKVANSYTINTGIISAKDRDNGNYFQFDALLNYGNSGGPVINKEGKFLGIATRPLTPSPISGIILPFSHNNSAFSAKPSLNDYTNSPNSGIGMSAKAEKVIATLPKLFSGAGIKKGNHLNLGLSPDKVNSFSSTIIVDRVQKNSPAEKAGFQKNDIIKSLDGVGVRSWLEINRYISQKKKGQIITFVIERPLEKPYLLLNGKKIDTIDKLNNFITNSNDQQVIKGKVFKPVITQKIYVTLD